MDPAKKAALKHALPKRGKSKALTRTEDFLKRQRDKAWLETHIWHAKRAHMADKWGYRLAVTPTEKSYRPSFRASQRGAIVHDASYFGVIELKGKQSTLVKVLARVLECSGAGAGAQRSVLFSLTADAPTHICAAFLPAPAFSKLMRTNLTRGRHARLGQ
jgi:ribonuclease P/MRP protein subunit POP1